MPFPRGLIWLFSLDYTGDGYGQAQGCRLTRSVGDGQHQIKLGLIKEMVADFTLTKTEYRYQHVVTPDQPGIAIDIHFPPLDLLDSVTVAMQCLAHCIAQMTAFPVVENQLTIHELDYYGRIARNTGPPRR